MSDNFNEQDWNVFTGPSLDNSSKEKKVVKREKVEPQKYNSAVRNGPIINSEYIQKEELKVVEKAKNAKLATLSLKIGGVLMGGLIIFSLVNMVSPFSPSNEALDLVKSGKLDLSNQTFEQAIQSRISEREESWQNYLNKAPEGSVTNVDSDYFGSPSYKYRNTSYDQAPGDVRPTFKVSDISWRSINRTGDGDKTPRRYVWVEGQAHITVFRPKSFTKEIVKVDEEDIYYGPYLVDTEDKIYTFSSGTGLGYEDFYDMDVPTKEWKHFPANG